MKKLTKQIIILCLLMGACKQIRHEPAANRLKNAASPYLQAHADNPVNWYEWGDEALKKAEKEDKPLLISIGYASCHWCHVMENESFMDTTVARIMNESFICIKVDREERPDIDNIYVHACQLLNNGEAGWPLNAFALPNGKPFFAGTYFTKEKWLQLLKKIAQSYSSQKNKVTLQANSLTYGMIDNNQVIFQQAPPIANKTAYQQLFTTVIPKIDPVNGGLKGRQKFPTTTLFDWLLQYQYLTKNKEALALTTKSLTKMALGGIYDHVGGGFGRYAIDSQWMIPHFEKMLYDNAQLVSLYAQAYKITHNANYKTVVSKTIDFLERDLSTKEGAFYSSLNADTKEGEGIFYSWKYQDILNALPEKDADLIIKYFNISKQGNWKDGNNILYASLTPDEFAHENNMAENDVNLSLQHSILKLLTIRNKRAKPSIDSKVLTSWNALMLSAYVDAYAAIGDKRYLAMALKMAHFLANNLLSANGSLMRIYKDGNTTIPAFLDDYAYLANAYIQLYGVTLDEYWLLKARKIADYALLKFYDTSSGMFFYSPNTSTELVVKKVDIIDQAMPSSNALFSKLLYGLGILFEEESYTNKSLRMTSTIAQKMKESPAYYASWAKQFGIMAYGHYEVAVVGAQAVEQINLLQHQYLPNCFFLGATNKENLPLLKGKWLPKKTMIYICNNKSCKLPVTDAAQALKQIK